MKYLNCTRGFSLMELVVVIIIMGILAAVGARKMTQQTEIERAQATLAEMEQIIEAIAGDVHLYVGGRRTDFGYIGNTGTIPASGTGTIGTILGNTEYNTDAWGDDYTWDATTLILSSTGNGTPVSKTLYTTGTLTPASYVGNVVNGIALDAGGNIPPAGPDSVGVSIRYQSGGTDSTVAGSSGQFTFNNVPIGNHTVRGYYQTEVVPRFVSVVPDVDSYGVEIVFTAF